MPANRRQRVTASTCQLVGGDAVGSSRAWHADVLVILERLLHFGLQPLILLLEVEFLAVCSPVFGARVLHLRRHFEELREAPAAEAHHGEERHERLRWLPGGHTVSRHFGIPTQ